MMKDTMPSLSVLQASPLLGLNTFLVHGHTAPPNPTSAVTLVSLLVRRINVPSLGYSGLGGEEREIKEFPETIEYSKK